MKVRLGFVSNSSSSSFLIGIVNLGKKLPEGELPFEIFKYKPECELEWFMDEFFPGKLSISSFKDTKVNCKAEAGDFIGYFNEKSGCDRDFYNRISGEFRYKIGLDFFHDDDIEMAKRLEGLGGSFIFGAGRDG